MRRLIVSGVLVAGVLWATANSFAQSPCCGTVSDTAPEFNGRHCRTLDQENLAAGCVENAGFCAGGDPLAGKGCVCVGDVCVSDGSVGSGNGTATARECTRDAVTACCEAGACEGDSAGRFPVPVEPYQPCAARTGGLSSHSACPSGCCLTIYPAGPGTPFSGERFFTAPLPPELGGDTRFGVVAEGDLQVPGAGLCVSDSYCRNPVAFQACAHSEPGPGPDPRCESNCCVTVFPSTAGVCAPANFCQ